MKFLKIKRPAIYYGRMTLFLFQILGYYYEIPSIGAIRINTQVSELAKSRYSFNTQKVE